MSYPSDDEDDFVPPPPPQQQSGEARERQEREREMLDSEGRQQNRSQSHHPPKHVMFVFRDDDSSLPPPPPPEEEHVIDSSPSPNLPDTVGRFSLTSPPSTRSTSASTGEYLASLSAATNDSVAPATRNPLGSMPSFSSSTGSISSSPPVAHHDLPRPPSRSSSVSSSSVQPHLSPKSVSSSGSSFSPDDVDDSISISASASSSNPLSLQRQSASHLTAAQDLGSGKSFASSLTHNFVGVSAQVEIGSYAAKRCASFMKKLSLAQEEYAKNLQKLLQHEQTKLSKLSQDHMSQHHKSWVSIQDIFAKLVKSHLSEAAEIQLNVVAPLQEFYLQQEDHRRDILQEERKVSLEMVRARDEVHKSLLAVTKLVDEARRLQSDVTKAQATGEKQGFFKSLTMKVTGKKPEEVIKEASKAAIVYQTSILTANKRQQRYLEQDLPKLFNDMQASEKKRLDVIKQRLLKFSTTATHFTRERLTHYTDLNQVISSTDADHDLHEYIEELLYESGPPPTTPRPFVYELTCSPTDIEAGRLEGNPNSIFRTSLEHCMELQKNANTNSDVPRIVPTLIQRIRELNGCTETGIFRLSVGKEDLDQLRKQIDVDQNYNLANVANPHICAALLKDWLRFLTDPLIPTEPFYQLAIESVKGTTGMQYDRTAIMKIYEALPSINQRILKHLADLVKEISNPSNVEKSKMNVENLAIVFAPSFLRNPSEDPLKLVSSKDSTRRTEAG